MVLALQYIQEYLVGRFTHRSKSATSWIFFVFCGFLLLGFTQSNQSEWQTPVNLSSTGSATKPTVVVDASGIARVIWVNENINSYVYLWGGANSWSGSRSVELPFGTRQYFPELDAASPAPLFTPILVADNRGNIHALWLDSEHNLYYSQVQAADFGSFSAWSSRQQLAEDVTAVSAAVDQNGGVHVSYIKTQADAELPEGVYYRQLPNRFASWSQPNLLYSSPYYQDLPANQANTSLAVGTNASNTNVYLTWDNSPREELFYIRSVDGGLSWEDPTLVDRRQVDDELSSAGPSNISVQANGNDVLRLWQAGHNLNNCNQYYQFSNDGGNNWLSPTVILEEITGCVQDINYLGAAGEVSLFSFFYQGQLYLVGWKDGQWSEPQVQQELTSITSPDTFRLITLDCQQLALVDGVQLLALACGTGLSEQTADIWQLSRAAGDVETWFPANPVWASPTQLIADVQTLIGPELGSDSQGNLHVLWSQRNQSDGSQSTIYYSAWEDGQWSQSVPILTSPEGSISQLATGITANDQLAIVWVTSSGKLFFSQTNAESGILRSEWAPPVAIPTSASTVTDADISISANGTYYVAYSVPVNESRGVYITESTDGKIWSDPVIAIDGQQSGWQIVGAPHLDVAEDNSLHLLVMEDIPQPGTHEWTPAALYYARSNSIEDDFEPPVLISETPSGWADLLDGDQQVLHQVWQEIVGNSTELRHSYSVNGGKTWTGPTRVGAVAGPLGVVLDNGGQLHALYISNGNLEHRFWNGSSWRIHADSGTLQLDEDLLGIPSDLNVALTPTQILGATITGQQMGVTSPGMVANTYFSWRVVETPSEISLAIPAPTSEPNGVSPDLIATPIEESTGTDVEGTSIEATPSENSALPESPDNSGSGLLGWLDTDNEIVRLVISLLPVALFLLIIFGVGIWMVRKFR